MMANDVIPQNRSNRTLTAVLTLFAVILAAAAVLSGLVFSDPNAGKGLESVPPTDTLVKSLLKSAITREECSFDKDEINGYLAYLYQQYDEDKKGEKTKAQAFAVAGMEGNSADVYLPFLYQGRHIGISGNVTPSIDTAKDQLVFKVNSARIGRLSVPAGWALKLAGNHLPDGFTVSGDTVSCKVPGIKVSYVAFSASVKPDVFRIENGHLKMGINLKAEIAPQ